MFCCVSDMSLESQFITVIFQDGPLGVTLRRRAKDGVVFVHDIVDNSQAVNMNINIDDELWAIGQSEIGDVALDKDAWKGLVEFIKFSPRPLKAVWKRYSNTEETVDVTEAFEDVHSKKNEESSDEEVTVQLQEPLHKTVKDSSIGKTKAISKTPPPKPFKPTSLSQPSSNLSDPASLSGKLSPLQTSQTFITKDNSNQSPVRTTSYDSSDCTDDLTELSSRLVLKDKEKSSFATGFIASSKKIADNSVNLVKDGRQFVRKGELEITSKASLAIFDKQNKRQFILLTDILIVAIPLGTQLQVENMIDLQVG